MTERQGLILVAGATGNQGPPAVRHLLANGWPVRALTRDPESAAGRQLLSQGAEVVGGDFDDRSSLDRAIAGAYGVFAVFSSLRGGPEQEQVHGIAVAEAAQAAGVRHLVYSSVGGAERDSGIPHFESKWQIEQGIRALGLPATILRLAFFMDNLVTPGFVGFGMWSAMAGAIGKAGAMQMIATDDIGAFAALSFSKPKQFIGQALEIAGDEVTLEQAVRTCREVRGKRPWFVPLPDWLLGRMDRDLATMNRWLREHGYAADIPALRTLHPDLKNLEAGLRVAEPLRLS
ncbi:MAG: NmrA family transcriptional regulator [Dehalococcoidia bacterium]|nr:NmrA family transcriptional regulator [Dehalococcoidia bacterium]